MLKSKRKLAMACNPMEKEWLPIKGEEHGVLRVNYGIYFNEYRSLKNGKGTGPGELSDYLEEKPSFDREA